MISFVFYFIIMLTFNLRLINAECDLQKEQFNINDQQINQIIMEEKVDSAVTYKSHSVTGIQLVEIDKTTDLASFFHFSVAENDTGSYLVTKTTENFGDFAKFAYSPNGGSFAILIITLSLSCGENPIVFNIVDSLSHLPEFSKGSYTFSLPMPILTSYQITFEDEIEVTEINFSNAGMSFATEPDDFNVITHQSSSSRKKFLAYLVAKNALQFDSKEYQLTATNTAGRTTSVTLTITADEVSSFDIPIFSNSAYRFNLITTNNENSLIPLDDDAPITVESNKLNTSFWFIEGDYKDYFTIEFANETGEFNVGLSADKILPRDLSDNQIFLILTFISDSSTNCIILVDILKIIPQFSNSFYSGVYNSDEEELIINWENEIMVSNAIKVSLPDNFLEIFEITNDTQERYLITPRRPLVDEDFSFGSDIIFNIFAVSNTTDVAEATIVISQQKSQIKMFQFDKVFYRATYSNDNVTLEDHLGFLNIESADKITIEVDDDKYKERFKLELGETDDEWKIYAIKKLDDLFLNSNSELAITITATKNSNEISNAVLILNIPDTVVVKFDALFYQGSYKIDEENNTAFESPSIKITGVNSEDINIFVEDYSEYLEVNFNKENATWTVHLIQPFSSAIQGPVVTNIEALRKSDNTILATSTLVISLSTDNDNNVTEKPQFSKIFYSGEYKSSDPASLETNDTIELISNGIDATIYIDPDEYSLYFNLEQQSNVCNISLNESLGREILDTHTNIVLTLMANSSQNSKGYALLVISLPKSTRNNSIEVENKEILFSASFENGIFSSPIIPLHFSNVTSIDNIKVDITNGENVDIFKYHLNGTLLYLEMDEVADDYLDNFSIIPLKLAITDKSTSDKIFVVVNVRINPSSNNREPDSPNNTSVLGLIIATSVLGVLLILTILAAIAYWYFKIRKAGYVEMETIESIEENPYFIKREPKEIEKPTELDIDIISTASNGQAKVENMYESASPEFGRNVTFNEKVKQIDNNNMEDAESPSYEFQSVATRRPTKFVFSPYNETEAEDVSKSESSDNLDELVVDELRRRNNSLENEGENKKSVVFNENIEKMHIEPPDENDGESEKDNEDDSAKKNNLTADTDEDESPASIFKEVIAEIEMKINKEK